MIFFIVEINWEVSSDPQRELHLTLARGNNSPEGNEMGCADVKEAGKRQQLCCTGVTAAALRQARGAVGASQSCL